MTEEQINQIGSGNSIQNSHINQQMANTINNDNRQLHFFNQLPTNKKISIIQEVLEGILDLNIELQPIILNTTDYTIVDKIDHNKIKCYKVALDFYMQESFLIEHRLKFLDTQKQATSSQRLYTFIKRIYMKHCGQTDPDQRITDICDEIKNDLIKYPNISDEDTALVPIIVFYVFSKCHIFEKPLIPL